MSFRVAERFRSRKRAKQGRQVKARICWNRGAGMPLGGQRSMLINYGYEVTITCARPTPDGLPYLRERRSEGRHPRRRKDVYDANHRDDDLYRLVWQSLQTRCAVRRECPLRRQGPPVRINVRSHRGTDCARRRGGWRLPLFAPEPLEIIEHGGDELLSAGVLPGHGAGERIE